MVNYIYLKPIIYIWTYRYAGTDSGNSSADSGSGSSAVTEPQQPDTETPETHVPDQSGNTETPKPAAKPTAPAKVTGVKISYKKSGKAILGWKKVKNASGYEIYRYQNKRWVKVKKVGKKTSFVIKKRSRKTVYYRVRAFRKKGKNVSYGKYSRKVKCKALQKAK